MTLDDLEGHSPNAGLIKCNSTNTCATFSTVLTVTARRAVPRRQLRFVFFLLSLHTCDETTLCPASYASCQRDTARAFAAERRAAAQLLPPSTDISFPLLLQD